MKKLLTISLSIASGSILSLLVLALRPGGTCGAAENCVARNGDANGDGTVDLSDAVTIIGNLFLGSPTTLLPLCPQPAASSSAPATGQRTCWHQDTVEGLWLEVPCGDAGCSGQDGDYAAGCPPEGRFADNGDGTVTDTCTGLMWQKDTADVDPIFEDTLVWCDALRYCEDLTFAGYHDWRLPNIRELQSIVDYGRREPSIDPVFGALPQYYWSSTSYAETADAAWGVGFTGGYVGIRNKFGDPDFSFNYVRAVRGGR